jgi:putative peptidoglycan lipid II flippase
MQPKPVLEATQPYATARSALGLAFLSVLSPAAGMAVEMAVAVRFGTSAAVDAFRVALAVIYLGQQFFIGSLFPNIIVPLFGEYRAQGRETEAWRSAISLANLALVPTLVLSAFLFVRPDIVVWILAPGLALQARDWAIFFVRWFGLGLIPFLYGGAALGLLYSQRIFWTSAGAQFAYNVALASSILLLGGLLGPTALAVGVLAGASASVLLQLARLAPVVSAAKLGTGPRTAFERQGVRKGIRLGIPLLASPLINQVSGIVACWALSDAPGGTIAALGYAGKLQRMVSLLPEAMATVLFPKLAAIAHSASREQLRDLSTRAVRMALFIALPITCVLFTLRAPLVALLFRHGAFSEVASLRVSLLLALFLAGLPAAILSSYLARVFYALQDTWWPMYATVASVMVGVAVMPPAAAAYSAEGVALCFAGVYWTGAIVRLAALHWRYHVIRIGNVIGLSLAILPFALAAAWLGRLSTGIAGGAASAGILTLGLRLIVGFTVALGSYWLATTLVRIPEALKCVRYLRWETAPLVRKMQEVLRG